MKNLILISFFFLTLPVFGQIERKESQEKDTITIFEMPEFPDGKNKTMEFIGKNIIFPKSAYRMKSIYRVYIDFIIDSMGNVTNAKVIKSTYKGKVKDYMNDLNNAALNVVLIMPKWKPATKNGKPFSTHYMIPITFAPK